MPILQCHYFLSLFHSHFQLCSHLLSLFPTHYLCLSISQSHSHTLSSTIVEVANNFTNNDNNKYKCTEIISINDHIQLQITSLLTRYLTSLYLTSPHLTLPPSLLTCMLLCYSNIKSNWSTNLQLPLILVLYFVLHYPTLHYSTLLRSIISYHLR